MWLHFELNLSENVHSHLDEASMFCRKHTGFGSDSSEAESWFHYFEASTWATYLATLSLNFLSDGSEY